VNGQEHNFPEMMLVETRALSLELFNKHFKHATETGLVYTSSTGIALMEALQQNDPQMKMGIFTPQQLEERGSDVWKDLMVADAFERRLALHTVLSTVPMGVFLNDRNGNIFDRACEVVDQMDLIHANETVVG
jgi:hypothetical protein